MFYCSTISVPLFHHPMLNSFTIRCSTLPPPEVLLFHHDCFTVPSSDVPLFQHQIFYSSTIRCSTVPPSLFRCSTIRCSTVPPSGVLKFHHLCSTVSPSLLRCSTISFALLHHQMFHWSTTSEGVLTFRDLQPVVLATWVFTTRGSYYKGFLQSGVLSSRGFYNQRFVHPGVLQPGAYTSRGLTASGSYIEAYNERFLHRGCLTTSDSNNQLSYIQGFLQPGVLHSGLVTTRVFTIRGSFIQGSYNQWFLHPGVLKAGVLELEFLSTMVS